MRGLKETLKWLFLGVAGLALVFVLFAKLSQWTTPNASQRETIAFMERDDLPDGRDAFALAWSLSRAVPFDEIEAVAAADVERAANWMDQLAPDSPEWETPLKDVDYDWQRDTYPALPSLSEDREVFCWTLDMNCLTKVREAPEATAAALARHQRRLERALRFRDSEVLRYGFAGGFVNPLLGFHDALLPLTSHALNFVQGDQAIAVSETCLDLAAWRRLSTHTDWMIGAMTGTNYAGRGYAGLLADMLSEWPMDQPLPAPCGTALALPLDRELLLCHAIRGEFRMTKQRREDLFELNRRQAPWYDRAVASVFWHDASTNALWAEMLAPYCRTDRPGAPDHDWPESGPGFLARWSCVGNLGGCSFVGIAHGGLDNFNGYADRMVDFGARLRLVGALAWMRERGNATGARADVLIERLPSGFTTASPPVELSPDGRSLRVAVHDTRWGDWEEAALPEALVP